MDVARQCFEADRCHRVARPKEEMPITMLAAQDEARLNQRHGVFAPAQPHVGLEQVGHPHDHRVAGQLTERATLADLVQSGVRLATLEADDRTCYQARRVEVGESHPVAES